MNAKEKIILVAKGIFAENKYEDATIKMICDKAEVNIASINYHFHSKKELYFNVIKSLHEKVYFKIKNILNYEVEVINQNEWEKFIQEITQTFLTQTENLDLIKWQKIVFREFNSPSEIFDELYTNYIKPVLEKIDLSIKAFFPNMPEEERIMWFLSLISQIGYIHNSKILIAKYLGNDFYKNENLQKYAKHINKSICSQIKVQNNNLEEKC